jgi:hypothetical protein
MENKVQLKVGEKVSPEEVLNTLFKEGIMFPKSVEKEDGVVEISDETIIAAQHSVIVELEKQRDTLNRKLLDLDNLNNQFYKAAQQANIRVFRDDKNQIKFEVVTKDTADM